MEVLTAGAASSLCSARCHFIFLKTFVLASSGLEVRMHDWRAGFVVSIISTATVLTHMAEPKQCGLLEGEFD